jgi:hypothetical protein
VNCVKVFGGDHPWFVVTFKKNRKYLFQIQAVGQYIWAGVACWKTKHSVLKGWQLSPTKLITPLFGLAFSLTPGKP